MRHALLRSRHLPPSPSPNSQARRRRRSRPKTKIPRIHFPRNRWLTSAFKFKFIAQWSSLMPESRRVQKTRAAAACKCHSTSSLLPEMVWHSAICGAVRRLICFACFARGPRSAWDGGGRGGRGAQMANRCRSRSPPVRDREKEPSR